MPRKVILGCTGSVAAIKVPEVVEALNNLTDVSIHLLTVLCLCQVTNGLKSIHDFEN